MQARVVRETVAANKILIIVSSACIWYYVFIPHARRPWAVPMPARRSAF